MSIHERSLRRRGQLISMDIEINDDLLTTMLLHGLSMSFENFRRVIENRDTLPTLEEPKLKILNESLARKSEPQGSERRCSLQSGSNTYDVRITQTALESVVNVATRPFCQKLSRKGRRKAITT